MVFYRCLDSPTGIAITEDEVTVRKLLSFPVLFVAGAGAPTPTAGIVCGWPGEASCEEAPTNHKHTHSLCLPVVSGKARRLSTFSLLTFIAFPRRQFLGSCGDGFVLAMGRK